MSQRQIDSPHSLGCQFDGIRPTSSRTYAANSGRQASRQASQSWGGHASHTGYALPQSVHRVSPRSPGRHGLPQPWHVWASPRWPLKPSSYADRPQASCPRCGPPAGAAARIPHAPTHLSLHGLSVTSGPQGKPFPRGPSAHRAVSEGTAPGCARLLAKPCGRPLLPVAGGAIYSFCPLTFHLQLIPIQTGVARRWQQPASTSRHSTPIHPRRLPAPVGHGAAPWPDVTRLRPCAPTRARRGTKGRSVMPAQQACRRGKPGTGRSGPPGARGRRISRHSRFAALHAPALGGSSKLPRSTHGMRRKQPIFPEAGSPFRCLATVTPHESAGSAEADFPPAGAIWRETAPKQGEGATRIGRKPPRRLGTSSCSGCSGSPDLEFVDNVLDIRVVMEIGDDGIQRGKYLILVPSMLNGVEALENATYAMPRSGRIRTPPKIRPRCRRRSGKFPVLPSIPPLHKKSRCPLRSRTTQGRKSRKRSQAAHPGRRDPESPASGRGTTGR